MRWMLPLSALTRLAAFAALAVSLGACTVVHVQTDQGVRTRYYPGIAVIQIAQSDAVQIIEVESIGATALGSHASLGWSRSQFAWVPPDRCQFIAWQMRAGQAAALQELFGPETEICDREGGVR
ncbi:MAG: hypothetical protein ACT4N8_12560 [Sphingosinicella sp.]|uniref:hypothetical protein n=1 Tax=Sphingosinicella sp. TaxID=1917971 RepID=UPI004037B18D